MLRNYLIAAIRNMLRNPLFTTIIVTGLTIAFATSIFITVFVYDKFHSESFVPESDRIYLVSSSILLQGHPPTEMPTTAPEVAAILKSTSSHIPATTRRHEVVDTPVRVGNLDGAEIVDWVDPNFFSVFQLRALAGDAKGALESPNGAVITRRIAIKYFGSYEVVGKSLELNRANAMTVTAVIEDLPANSTLTGQIYASAKASFSPVSKLDAERAHSALSFLPTGNIITYAQLSDSGDFGLVTEEIARYEKIRSPYPQDVSVSLQLTALNDLHLHMPGQADTSMTMILGISLVGLVILVMAGINFVNLMTARASARAKEIGIRKAAGANRRHLMLQFFGESALFVGLSVLLGVGLVLLVEPLLTKYLFQSPSLGSYPWLLREILAGAVIFALFAGFYPALVLSALLPQAVLRGSVINSGRTSLVREGLVAIQFAFLIAIVVVTVVMSRQIRYATHDVLHFDSKNILVLDSRCVPSFTDEVRKLPGVESLFCSSGAPLSQSSMVPLTAAGEDGAPLAISGLAIDFEFFNFYGVEPIAGRLPDAVFGTDKLDGTRSPTSIVVNEKAMYQMGFTTPNEALGRVVHRVFANGSAGKIIGVVPDFVIGPVHEEIRPLFLYINFDELNRISMKISPDKIPTTMARIEQLWNQQHFGKQFTPSFLNQLFNWTYRDMILESEAFAAISAIALFTAAFGLFGLSVYNAQSRTKEIGIRKAMGASRLDIALMLTSRFARPMALSLLMSWPAAYFAARYWLHGIANHIDLRLSAFFSGSTYALSILGATVFLHAWKTARVDPAGLLRYE